MNRETAFYLALWVLCAIGVIGGVVTGDVPVAGSSGAGAVQGADINEEPVAFWVSMIVYSLVGVYSFKKWKEVAGRDK